MLNDMSIKEQNVRYVAYTRPKRALFLLRDLPRDGDTSALFREAPPACSESATGPVASGLSDVLEQIMVGPEDAATGASEGAALLDHYLLRAAAVLGAPVGRTRDEALRVLTAALRKLGQFAVGSSDGGSLTDTDPERGHEDVRGLSVEKLRWASLRMAYRRLLLVTHPDKLAALPGPSASRPRRGRPSAAT